MSLILHFKWSIPISLILDTTHFKLDKRGRASSKYEGVEKYTQTFLFSKLSMPTLRPTKPPIQWTQGILSLGRKQLGQEA
jgi:hypothetical protein